VSAPRSLRRASLALVLGAGLGACVGAVAGAPAFASGAAGGAPGQSGSTGSTDCPSPNPPDQLTLVGGTPQTTPLDTAFASSLQVALTNSDGCAVTGAAGVPVTFSAPAAGASGCFSATNSNTVTVGADSSGGVPPPTFEANTTAGSYIVTASSQYGSVSFSLTNTAAGIPAQINAIPLEHRSATVTAHFRQPLQVRVLDAGGNPVAGATVTFALASAVGGGACGTGAAASASFAGGGTQATATTDASGLATSPALTANAVAGSFTAIASVSSGGGGGAESAAGKAGTPSVTSVRFSLVNLAGRPAKIAPGVGSTQSTRVGAAFPIRLAVTVTDAEKNPVPRALVTFSAPAAGASGRFTIHSRRSHRHHRVAHVREVKVRTGACGIAVAPRFTAGRQPGGYIVKAGAKSARPAAFALVNEAR
jgi:hypothetical protein